MYLIPDDKCIYNDFIVCKKTDCENCDKYVNRQMRKVFKKFDGEQLNLFDLINEKRTEYAKKSNRKRSK